MTTITDFNKIMLLGRGPDGDVWVRASYTDGRLSLVGVEGPKSNGNCVGGAGQIGDHLEIREFAANWDGAKVKRLAEIWDRWHLNDMQAGTPRQEEFLRSIRGEFPGYPVSHYEWAKERLAAVGLQPDPDTGYSYGSAWLRVDVPAEVLDEIRAFPDTDRVCPWEDL